MREIKFRAWDKKKNKWVTPVGNHLVIQWAVPWDNKEHVLFGFHGKNWELMQYTGLKDKNGVEIYEGDILKYSPTAQWTHIVEWGFQEAGEPADGNHATFLGWDVPLNEYGKVELEVIGNIYENPELLTKNHE